jgi:hypothetical protein
MRAGGGDRQIDEFANQIFCADKIYHTIVFAAAA